MICNARASYYVGQAVLGFSPIPSCLNWSIVQLMASAWLRCKAQPPQMGGSQVESFVRLFVRAKCTCSLKM